MRTTNKLIALQFGAQGLGVVVVLAIGLAGCPHNPPPPAPIGPDASDAAPAPDPLKTCVEACTHAETVCMGAGDPCGPACARLHDPKWNACVAAVPAGPDACKALSACDPLSGASGARARPTGR